MMMLWQAGIEPLIACKQRRCISTLANKKREHWPTNLKTSTNERVNEQAVASKYAAMKALSLKKFTQKSLKESEG